MLFGFNGRATRNFLILLVSMHYILFINRVNLAAAAPVMQQDLGLSNLALGIAFSAFNYAYAPFQLVGGWFADRFGARRTLTVCGLVVVDHDNRDGGGGWAFFAVCRPLCARDGRRCHLAGGDARVVQLDLARVARHGGWHHPCRRASRRGIRGADRRPPDRLVLLAFFIRRSRPLVGSLGGLVVVVFSRGSAPASRHHRRGSGRIADR